MSEPCICITCGEYESMTEFVTDRCVFVPLGEYIAAEGADQ